MGMPFSLGISHMTEHFTQHIITLFWTLNELCDEGLLEDRNGESFKLEILVALDLAEEGYDNGEDLLSS
jgi:hypothetical protein